MSLAPVLSVSVVIPVFRAEKTLRRLHDEVSRTLAGLGARFEIILVEDAGGDRSWSVIGDLARTDARVLGLRMSRNYCQHNALLCGVRAATYDIILTMDD